MKTGISGRTRLYGLLGSPVGHSGSPAMYNYSFKRLGIDGVYLAFDVPLEKLAEGVAAMRALHVGGFNITMPCKSAVLRYLDELTPAVRLIGACNTVTADEEGRLTGHNTDGTGFVRNLREHGVDVKGKRLVVFGAGGAATAICVQAALEGAAQVAIFNRNDKFYPNGQRVAQRIAQAVPGCRTGICRMEDQTALAEAVEGCDILVNATRVGMRPLDKVTLVDPLLFRRELVVADAVYEPEETRMLREARNAGCRTVGGLGMLLWQGVDAFRLFTGRDMPVEKVAERFFWPRADGAL